MAAQRVIGIDAGGTKLLGGVVDADLRVQARVHRLWGQTDRGGVLAKMVEEVEAALSVAPDVEAIGARGMAFERLDQLALEHLYGLR